MRRPDHDHQAFRRALGNFATGVTVITARAPDGRLAGVTANSFSALSLDPPLILWSNKKDSRSRAVFEAASHFAVNILASDQLELSNHFARRNPDKFAGIDWQEGLGGAPILPGCAGRFQCRTHDRLDGGDHRIFIGRVLAFDDFGRPPLCFHQGSYAMLFNHPDIYAGTDREVTASAEESRMRDDPFFLMLRALRAYQDRFLPKLTTLGLSLIEARILLVLNDLSPLAIEDLVVHLHAPYGEAQAALASLGDRGLVAAEGARFRLTLEGREKATACWQLTEAHAGETFERFSKAQLAAFTGMLRQIIGQ
ncbi:p-hydroxyphenylacetate 3-hydroxylase reductase component [Albidovulum sp.]